jgi:hypothetical protein
VGSALKYSVLRRLPIPRPVSYSTDAVAAIRGRVRPRGGAEPMADNDPTELRDVFFEITVLGTTAKVSAIDSASGIEVMVLGPASAAETELKRLALAKLRTRLARQAS